VYLEPDFQKTPETGRDLYFLSSGRAAPLLSAARRVLRDGSDEPPYWTCFRRGLARLAEEKQMNLAFPNPLPRLELRPGPARPDDVADIDRMQSGMTSPTA
jgi:hypothetical protein